MDSMLDLLGALPGLGEVGGPGPLSRAADTDTIPSALEALACAAGWPPEAQVWVDVAGACVVAVHSALAVAEAEGDTERVAKVCGAIAALSEGEFAAAGGGPGMIPETYPLSAAVGGVMRALANASRLNGDGEDHGQTHDAASRDGGGGAVPTHIEWDGWCVVGRPGDLLVPNPVERNCIEAIARILCSCALDSREVATDIGTSAGLRAATIGLRAAERLVAMAEVAGGSGGGIRVDADADLLDTVQWAVSCVHSVVLGGGGTSRLSHMACELGLDAALAFCSAVPGATEAEQDQLADAATTSLRLTALVLREDAMGDGALTVDVLKSIESMAGRIPVPPLRLAFPPCEFEVVVDTIRSACRSRITCLQFLARR